jgi:hypothetical protein
MRGIALVLALALPVPVPAQAEPDVLERAATFDPTVHFGSVGKLEIKPLVETRWTCTETSGPDRATVVGFSVPRARLKLTASLFDAFDAVLRIGAKSDGTATFQQAFAEGRWSDFRLRAGQMDLVLNGGEQPSAGELSPIDFSSYANTFAGGQTQGVQLRYDGPVRLTATVSNGARTGFSELLSPIVADVATTLRAEAPMGSRRVEGFDAMPSFRKGQEATARIGVVAHWQTAGSKDTNPGTDVAFAGGDLGVRGSGFSLLGSFTYMRIVQHGAPAPSEEAGAMIFGSYFPVRRVEVWAQGDAVYPLGARVPLPPHVASGQPGTTLFGTLSIGSNFYVVPDVHRLKVQLDVQTMFDAQRTGPIPPDAALGVLQTSGPQVAGRIQLVVAL